MSVGTNIQTVNLNNNVQPKMQTNFRAQSSPVKDYPPDTVEINGKKKNGLSNGAKAGIGLGILGTAALAIGLIMKSRGSQAKEVIKHIDFKEAKTIEEAKKFAREKLGINYIEQGNAKFDDIEMVNFLNEYFTKINNNSKLGRDAYPKLIHSSDCQSSFFDITNKNIKLNGVDYGYALGVNTKYFSNFKSELENILTSISDIKTDKLFFYKKSGQYSIARKELDTDFVRNFLTKVNNSDLTKLSYKDKLQIYMDLFAMQEGKIVNGKLVEQKNSLYTYLNHETGHLLHFKNSKNIEQMRKVKEYINNGQEVSELTKEFVNNKDIQTTASKVSNYAKESPLEFVAETFAGLRDGIKFDDDVMALYKKYNGPMI